MRVSSKVLHDEYTMNSADIHQRSKVVMSVTNLEHDKLPHEQAKSSIHLFSSFNSGSNVCNY